MTSLWLGVALATPLDAPAEPALEAPPSLEWAEFEPVRSANRGALITYGVWAGVGAPLTLFSLSMTFSSHPAWGAGVGALVLGGFTVPYVASMVFCANTVARLNDRGGKLTVAPLAVLSVGGLIASAVGLGQGMPGPILGGLAAMAVAPGVQLIVNQAAIHHYKHHRTSLALVPLSGGRPGLSLAARW